MPGQLRYWRDVGDFFGVGVEREVFRHLPDADLTILRA